MPQPGGTGAGGQFCPYPQAGGNAFPPYPTGGYGGGFPPYPQPNASGATNSNSSNPGYPPYMPGGYPPMAGYNSEYTPPAATGAQNSGTITEEHIKASLISAVEDKLRRRIQERVNQCQAEIQTLNRTKLELQEGRTKINDIMSKLEREENELKKNISVLEDKDRELEKSLESLQKVDGIDVDEAVITTAPLYRQLVESKFPI